MDKMAKWELSDKEKDAIINYLIEEKYINEERFALFYARDKHRFQQWGKKKIALMLRSKGIGEREIEIAISNIEEEDYEEQIFELLNKKFTQIKYETLYEATGKLFRYGTSRGFESDLVLKTCERIINEHSKR